jgi:hypothetical protein
MPALPTIRVVPVVPHHEPLDRVVLGSTSAMRRSLEARRRRTPKLAVSPVWIKMLRGKWRLVHDWHHTHSRINLGRI